MVDKITIFEPHFDGAQFGPAAIPGDALPGGEQDTADEPPAVPVLESDDEPADSGGRRLPRKPVLAVVAVVLGVLAVRRRLGRPGSREDPDLE